MNRIVSLLFVASTHTSNEILGNRHVQGLLFAGLGSHALPPKIPFYVALLKMNGAVTRRVSAVLGSALFLVLVPGTVAGLVPRWISGWNVQAPLLGLYPLRFVGGLLVAVGVAILLDSFVRFAFQGIGTPAPVFPTRHLVVTGLYRYVRNPIYIAVVSVIVGQGLIFGNVSVLEYAAFIWLAFYLFVWAYEEPTLRKNFGAEYERFCAGVPRWIPRLSPWKDIE
jgi:protein-S-isoprenylcysteine O-methyltransferase Ste14